MTFHCEEREMLAWIHSPETNLFLTKLLRQLWPEDGSKRRDQNFQAQLWGVMTYGWSSNSNVKSGALPLYGALQLRETLGMSGLTGSSSVCDQAKWHQPRFIIGNQQHERLTGLPLTAHRWTGADLELQLRLFILLAQDSVPKALLFLPISCLALAHSMLSTQVSACLCNHSKSLMLFEFHFLL